MTESNPGAANPELDQALDDYLAGESEISRRYGQQARERTPAELDNRVLAAAHKKSGAANPARKPARRPSRWLQRLAGVAVLVLGLALTLDLLQDQSIIPADKQLPAPATNSRNALDEPARTESAAATSPELREQQSATSGSQTRGAASRPDQDTDEREALAPGHSNADASEPAEPPPPGIEDEPIQAPPVPTQVTPPVPVASAPEPIEQESIEQAPSLSGSGSGSGPNRAPQPTSQTDPAGEPYAGPPLPQAPSGEPAFRKTPQTWLRHIIFLADTGQSEEARAELSQFRERHPQARVPAELEPLGGE